MSSLDQRLLSMLVCPQDKQALDYVASENLLYNARLQCSYEVHNDIPVLLVDEAKVVDAAEHERISQLIAAGQSKRTGPKTKEGQ
jgi:uncharacterized protein